MKTLSVLQPWASLIAEGVKTIELRSWSTNYRGQLLIRASKNSSMHWEGDDNKRIKLPTECFICVVELVDVRSMEPADKIKAMSVYMNDLFSWHMHFKYYVYPAKAAGKLKLYDTACDQIVRLPDDEIRKYHSEFKSRTLHPFRASVVDGELVVLDSRNGEQAFITVHQSNTPPLAWVMVPMYGYIGGLRGGNSPITLNEVADSINEGNCYQNIEALLSRLQALQTC